MDLGPVEIRVLGCLVEKQRTTPDAYPLTLNALRLACNQATNRNPVLDLDEAAIRAALERLARRRWTRLASGPGSRAPEVPPPAVRRARPRRRRAVAARPPHAARPADARRSSRSASTASIASTTWRRSRPRSSGWSHAGTCGGWRGGPGRRRSDTRRR